MKIGPDIVPYPPAQMTSGQIADWPSGFFWTCSHAIGSNDDEVEAAANGRLDQCRQNELSQLIRNASVSLSGLEPPSLRKH